MGVGWVLILCKKTLEELRKIINGDGTDDYKSGPKLVDFFNELGFNDSYGQGFPSRWFFTDCKLEKINGTPAIDKCIKTIFSVNNYIGRVEYLDEMITKFNQYLAFDKWRVIRVNEKISFEKLDEIIVKNKKKTSEMSEKEFLQLSFDSSIDRIGLEYLLTDILKMRILEAESNISIGNSLSSIILIGSVMEGILLGVVLKYPDTFNKCNSAPIDNITQKVKKFNNWTLNDFINSAYELRIINEDVKKFSHVVREFRNYIHPYQQLQSQFRPTKDTALICLQVLKALISQLEEYTNKSSIK